MDIRRATSKDSHDLSRIALQVAAPFKGRDYTDHGWAQYERGLFPRSFDGKIKSKNFLVLVFRIEEDILGYIVLENLDEIKQFFVVEGPHYEEIVESLWAAAQTICGENGGKGYFFTHSQLSFVNFYESIGFRRAGETKWIQGFHNQMMEVGQK